MVTPTIQHDKVTRMQEIQQDISTLSQLPKFHYDTIIWDLRNQKNLSILGGSQICSHEQLDSHNRCNCGAYRGYIRKMSPSEFQEKVLTELAISPAKDLTIIIHNNPIGDDKLIHNPIIHTPKYHEILWLSKYGTFWDVEKQVVTALTYFSKKGMELSQSKYIVNTQTYDPRLLDFGTTLLINPPKKWRRDSDLLTYIWETEQHN